MVPHTSILFLCQYRGPFKIEEHGGTAISFSADVSMEAEVESMMRAVSSGSALGQRMTNNLMNGTCYIFLWVHTNDRCRMLMQAIDTWGTLDVLVNNAGPAC
jgi:NAD(P)-dependent dehydrogenase (short-subunit alcohol dehydrogenase family)